MGGGSDFQFVYKGYHHFMYSSSSRTCPVCCALFEEKKETMNDTTSKKVLLESVNYLLALPSRRERNEILGKKNGRSELLPEEYLEEYERLRKREYRHIQHVRLCYSTILNEQPKTNNSQQYSAVSLHDYSKDEFYLFVTILAFSFSLKDVLPYDLLQAELDRHFTLEPHHPEYEKLNAHKGLRIRDRDIAEMALDRLSRNLQFNNGNYNNSQIEKYEPQFLFDNKRRIELYRKYVKDFKPVVLSIWNDMK